LTDLSFFTQAHCIAPVLKKPSEQKRRGTPCGRRKDGKWNASVWALDAPWRPLCGGNRMPVGTRQVSLEERRASTPPTPLLHRRKKDSWEEETA
jgi:hypothetical protein